MFARIILVAFLVVFTDLSMSAASRGDTGAPPSPSPAPSSTATDAPKSSSAPTSGSLQQDASNPIGNLTQLPFQYNMNFGVGLDRHVQDLVNFQPVVPFELSTRNTLLVRTVVP